jgi:hypothetical protein
VVALETARAEWEEAHRRLESYAGEPDRYTRLLDQVEAVTDELAKRVGQTFTLATLAEAYGSVDRWSRDAVAERAPAPGWPRTLSVVEGEAFHRYQRGAVDYEP